MPKLSLSGWLFVSAHAHQLRSKFDALLSECTLLREEIEPLKGRFPLLEPRGIALNREWFKRDGEERREELKGLMEGFKAAAPGDDGAQDLVKVEEMLKFMLEMVGRAKVKVTALRDVLGQYSMLSVLNIMNM